MSDSVRDEARRIRRYYAGASWRTTSGSVYLVDERRRALDRIVDEQFGDVAQLSVCDVGCGGGGDLAHWRGRGVPDARLFGTELDPQRVDEARALLPASRVEQVTGFEIPLPDRSVMLTTANLVLSSVLDPDSRRRLLAEMRRVTKPGGLIGVYDFVVRKPWNTNVRAVRRHELVSLMGTPRHELRLAPFLPLLTPVLRLPSPVREAVMAVMPRTHRLWVWEVPGR